MAVNLDELEKSAEKLLELLKDRQSGLACWHMFMHDRLLEMEKLIADALGKVVSV